VKAIRDSWTVYLARFGHAKKLKMLQGDQFAVLGTHKPWQQTLTLSSTSLFIVLVGRASSSHSVQQALSRAAIPLFCCWGEADIMSTKVEEQEKQPVEAHEDDGNDEVRLIRTFLYPFRKQRRIRCIVFRREQITSGKADRR
jgi:hypothetical protein